MRKWEEEQSLGMYLYRSLGVQSRWQKDQEEEGCAYCSNRVYKIDIMIFSS